MRPGDLYAALPGFSTHGARFAAQAVAAGAVAILTDPAGGAADRGGRSGAGRPGPGRERSARAAGCGRPTGSTATRRGTCARTGITGTNGKTTTSYLLDAALRAGGLAPTGIIGTVATHIGDEEMPASRTTPEAPDLHALLAVMVQRGVRAVTLEVSSHALTLGRVDGVRFDLAVFTNLVAGPPGLPRRPSTSYFAAKADALHVGARARRRWSASTTTGVRAWPSAPGRTGCPPRRTRSAGARGGLVRAGHRAHRRRAQHVHRRTARTAFA